MNKEELQNEINKTKEHLKNMEKMLEDCEYERWKPKEHEIFYSVDSFGDVYTQFFDSGDSFVKELLSRLNCFQTKEQAQVEFEKILVRRQLEDIAKRLNKGEKVDWRDDSQPKFYLYYNCCSENIKYGIYYHSKIAGVVYCLTEKLLDIAKEEIGEERLIKYLKGE